MYVSFFLFRIWKVKEKRFSEKSNEINNDKEKMVIGSLQTDKKGKNWTAICLKSHRKRLSQFLFFLLDEDL